jgi:hypothetical protein
MCFRTQVGRRHEIGESGDGASDLASLVRRQQREPRQHIRMKKVRRLSQSQK